MPAEFRVHSAKLQGFPPFPTWNETIASPAGDSRGLCSILGADGELVVLQNSRKDDNSDSCLRVVKVLPPAEGNFSSFCQCWTHDGAVIATAHDQSVVFYSTEHFCVLTRLKLQYSVTSMGITKRSGGDTEYLLMIGTAFGGLMYNVKLDAVDDEDNVEPVQSPTPVARVHDGVAVCMVKFSSDGCTAALGTTDGRIFLQRLGDHDDDTLATFGTAALSRVLQAPRITGLSFSECSKKLVVATRKGNVYVFASIANTGQWQLLPSCRELSGNPQPKAGTAVGANKAATAAQTLVFCWGPVFVVCSRAIESRLEMYDFVSGRLLHSLQLPPAAPAASAVLSQWVDQQLVTAICGLQLPDGTTRLLCHDTSANVAVVEWPFLDVMARR